MCMGVKWSRSLNLHPPPRDFLFFYFLMFSALLYYSLRGKLKTMEAQDYKTDTSDGRKQFAPDGSVLAQYLMDRSEVSIIRGPIGSGTSSCSCMKIWMIASEQRLVNGKRKSRWFIVRNTYGELRDTTMKTWLEWFPEEIYGIVALSRPMRHFINIGEIELEVYFLALDTPDDIKVLRSRETTGVWFNELEFQTKALFDEAQSRCRWPAKKDGGSNWYGVIGDMNAPTSENWVVQMAGEAPLPDEMPEDDKASFKMPKQWSYFVQPSAMNDVYAADGKTLQGYEINLLAENVKWLPTGYYERMIPGKTRQWIKSRLQNKITFYTDGEPVWPMFDEEAHLSTQLLLPMENYEVWVSLDFGRARPAALIAQRINERIQCQYEFRMYGVSAVGFAPALKRFLAVKYGNRYQFRFCGDPKGQDKGQADERSAYDIFKANGMDVMPAPVKNNHSQTRLSAVESVLTDMHNGKSRLIVSAQGCQTLTAALRGGYHVKKNAMGDPEPVKDKFSDIADCLQYLCLSMGEGRRMIGMPAIQITGRMDVRAKKKSNRRVS